MDVITTQVVTSQRPESTHTSRVRRRKGESAENLVERLRRDMHKKNTMLFCIKFQSCTDEETPGYVGSVYGELSNRSQVQAAASIRGKYVCGLIRGWNALTA